MFAFRVYVDKQLSSTARGTPKPQGALPTKRLIL